MLPTSFCCLRFKATISLLIFCLEDLSIDVNGVLKSPTLTLLLSVSPFRSIKICFTYLGASALGAQIFTRVIASCWIAPFSVMQCPSLSLTIAFVLKSILSNIKCCYPSFFFISTCIKYLFSI